jgi:hypothetical protein
MAGISPFGGNGGDFRVICFEGVVLGVYMAVWLYVLGDCDSMMDLISMSLIWVILYLRCRWHKFIFDWNKPDVCLFEVRDQRYLLYSWCPMRSFQSLLSQWSFWCPWWLSDNNVRGDCLVHDVRNYCDCRDCRDFFYVCDAALNSIVA